MTHLHAYAYGGHVRTLKANAKIIQVSQYWSGLFKDVHSFIKKCDQCQHTRNILKRNEILLNDIMEVENFDVWGIDILELSPSSLGNWYILVADDYVFKWIQVITSPRNDA